jgi:DNA-binding transcriptional LysR family regulator
LIPVVAPRHPLARVRGALSPELIAGMLQIVLSERGDAGTEDQSVLSLRSWRVADLHTKHRMLLAGLGWGTLPEHLVREDLDEGRLVAIRPADWSELEARISLYGIFRTTTTIGPAHRWLLDRLARACAAHTRKPAATGKSKPSKRR